MINKPQTTISDWETGKLLPDIGEAVKIATALHIRVTDLLEETQGRMVGESS
ncbi:MAG: helix-turn-helix transcriptional regulator [Desulfocucumaceae bacterium]